MNLSYPLLMGLGLGTGEGNNGGELNSLMLAQFLNGMGSAPQSEEMSKQLQRMMMAPIAKRFSENLARKIMALSDEGKARLMASLVTNVMSGKQEGDVAAMLDMCAMTGIMGLLNGSATPDTGMERSGAVMDLGTGIGIGTGAGVSSRQLRKIGGSFKGVLESPIEEVKSLAIPQSLEQSAEPRKKIRGRL